MLTIASTAPPTAPDSWTAGLPLLLSLLSHPDEREKAFAATELTRMADLADRYQDAVSLVLVPA